MIGETSYQPFAINTFSHNGRSFATLTPAHYVRPHQVSSYTRHDGTFVEGFWRDGDGDTSVNRATGYFARNPNAIPQIVKGGWL
jgi:hypothetical protein